MSNPLSVCRTEFQTIDEGGNHIGEPTFGVVAADGYAEGYNDTFDTIDALNDAIEDAGCILAIIGNYRELWQEADLSKIGTDNYYGKDWTKTESPEV